VGGRPRTQAPEVAVAGDGTIEAAGGVVLRPGPEGLEILAVHRPKYDDWSLPKGKLEPGESHAAAALREVEEETAWRCELGEELPDVRYRDRNGRPKHVRYWRMTPLAQGTFTPTAEVDNVLWLSLRRAATLLSYDADRRLLDRVLEGLGEES
jgi:8-oxo-dGTP pyrophosphatase MutT (NUDIX family)